MDPLSETAVGINWNKCVGQEANVNECGDYYLNEHRHRLHS
jgi:hypothetical protein